MGIPKATLDQTIKKALTAKQGDTITFEARWKTYYFIIECCSDKPHRTVQPLRKLFKDAGGLVTSANEVKWMFKQRGSVQVHGPVTSVDVDRMKKSLQYLHSHVQQVLRGTLTADECMDELDENILSAFAPSSISLDALTERAIEFDTEDVQEILIPPTELISPLQLPLLHSPDFNQSTPDWTLAFPRIRGLQIMCQFDTLQKLTLGMETFNSYGQKPAIRSSQHIWMPNTDTFSGDSIWQQMPSNSEDSETLTELLAEVRGTDDVVNVYHNIIGVEPWDEIEHSD